MPRSASTAASGDTEFGLIDAFFRNQAGDAPEVVVGIGDDAAILDPPPDCVVLVTSETLGTTGDQPWPDPLHSDRELVSAPLRELREAQATPAGCTLALTLPHIDGAWLEIFSSALRQLTTDAGLPLIGGDTTRGPLALTLHCLGFRHQDVEHD